MGAAGVVRAAKARGKRTQAKAGWSAARLTGGAKGCWAPDGANYKPNHAGGGGEGQKGPLLRRSNTGRASGRPVAQMALTRAATPALANGEEIHAPGQNHRGLPSSGGLLEGVDLGELRSLLV